MTEEGEQLMRQIRGQALNRYAFEVYLGVSGWEGEGFSQPRFLLEGGETSAGAPVVWSKSTSKSKRYPSEFT